MFVNRNTGEVLSLKRKKIPEKKKIDYDFSDIVLSVPRMPEVERVHDLVGEDIKEKNIIKEIIVYPKEKCNYVGEDGVRCKRLSVGEYNVCEKHGGDPVIVQNLYKNNEIPDVLRGKKYDPAYHPMEYLSLAKDGMSAVEIAAEFEISLRELKNWSETFEEFNKAFEIGEALHESWYLKNGKDNLDNRGYNVELFKFITGNKLGWSTKTESKNLNVTAGVLLMPRKKTEEEWIAEHGIQDAEFTVSE